MAIFKQFSEGQACWVDCSSTDPEAAKKFYSQLFGWNYDEIPIPEGGTYIMALKNGERAGAIMQQMDGEKSMGVPSHWNTYLNTADLEATTERAKNAGATVIVPPMDVMDIGRMSIISDPTGAVVTFWEAKGDAQPTIANEIGTWGWNELLTTDAKKAGAFWNTVFGWTTTEAPAGNGSTYYTFHKGDAQVGGMLEINPGMGPIPPNWMVYFGVQDCDASVAKVTELGGKVFMGTTEIEIGKFAVCQDPAGAAFSIIALNEWPN